MKREIAFLREMGYEESGRIGLLHFLNRSSEIFCCQLIWQQNIILVK